MGIAEKRIEELKGMKFNVPSYQRGYRWTKHEVTTLLEDLYNHDSKLKMCIRDRALTLDKKASGNQLKLVLVPEIGTCQIHPVPLEEMRDFIH